MVEQEFRRRANHSYFDIAGRFDLSNTVYNGLVDKTEFLCKLHGKFDATPRQILSGAKCPHCRLIRTPRQRGFSTTEKNCVEIFQTVFGEYYDYSQLVWGGTANDIFVACPHHGDFAVKPSRHRQGVGCPECYPLNLTNREDFVRKASTQHLSKYKYGQYRGSTQLADVFCHQHGLFQILPSAHLARRGCPICDATAIETQVDKWLATTDLSYQRQVCYNHCRPTHNLGHLKFSFYLSDHQLLLDLHPSEIQGYPADKLAQTLEFKSKWSKTQGFDLKTFRHTSAAEFFLGNLTD